MMVGQEPSNQVTYTNRKGQTYYLCEVGRQGGEEAPRLLA